MKLKGHKFQTFLASFFRGVCGLTLTSNHVSGWGGGGWKAKRLFKTIRYFIESIQRQYNQITLIKD